LHTFTDLILQGNIVDALIVLVEKTM